MRKRSRAQVRLIRERGNRPRKDQKVPPGKMLNVRGVLFPGSYVRPPAAFGTWGRPLPSPAPLIGDDMRQKFAARGARDIELSQAHTAPQVEEIMRRYEGRT